MFERNEDLNREIDRLYKVTERMGRGDILTYDAITRTIGLRRSDKPTWDRIIYRVLKRLLAERKIDFMNIRNVGYELCTPDKQLNESPQRRIRKAKRQLRRAREAVDAIPDYELKPHQQKRQLFVTEMLREQENSLRYTYAAVKGERTPSVVAPRRPITEGV